MSTPLSATRFVNSLKSSGVSYRTRKGWETHNRAGHGAWGPVNGVMIHHTGAYSTQSAMVDLCWDGYDALPGPLCHGVIDRAGTVHLVGWGRANHAGKGDPAVLDHVIAEDMPYPRPRYGNTDAHGVDGNARFYGFELINKGDGTQVWPPEQLEAAQRAAAAICRAHGWSERSVIGHKEWQRGKIDPDFSMDAFRRGVRVHL